MKVSVLMGGTSSEREVSLKTGKAVISACLELGYETTSVDFNGDYDSILEDLKYSDIVFNALHGTFGEDGTIQSLLESNDILYTGSGPESSKLCMDKNRSKTGNYDCVVPWSGGKDSSMIACKLKFEFGLNPLLVTFSPVIPTEIGSYNRQQLINLSGHREEFLHSKST